MVPRRMVRGRVETDLDLRAHTMVTPRGVLVDVPPMREAIQALRDSEELNRAVVETLEEGVIVMDPDGVALTCNASAARILRTPQDEIIGLRAPFVTGGWSVAWEDGTPLTAASAPVAARRGVVVKRIGPDGHEVWLSINYLSLIHI